MADISRATKTGLVLFAIASLFTFGFITLLQFTPMPWFFLVLIAMHIGIALFIVSKRLFKQNRYTVARYFRFEYLMLVPYLLIMGYAFASKAGLIPLFETEKILVTVCYTALCFIMTAWNFNRMVKDVRDQHTVRVVSGSVPSAV